MISSIRVDPEVAARLTPGETDELGHSWGLWARQEQWPPRGAWTTWLLIGGRGSGKTRAGAEWIRSLANAGVTPLALVGETMTEAIEIMVRGESGLFRIHAAGERPVLKGNVLAWPNGVTATVLPASDPERFRGPQFAAAWCDEIGKWPDAETAWDMLQFGLRLGRRPRQLATTTPRPTRLIRRLLSDPQTAVTRMRTDENAQHLAPGFLDAVVGRYRGTVLGRQELDGELIEDLPDALWNRGSFVHEAGTACERIVVAVDPPVTGGPKSDACGIVVAGRKGPGAVVLADLSFRPAPPLKWAQRAVRAYEDHHADCVVVEVNQGGDLVKQVIAQVDPAVPVRAVRANRGKWVRAEPVAALYERGLVRHVPGLDPLEDEMCALESNGLSNGRSPDRVDALVWALTELMLGEDPVVPRLRGI